VALALSVLLVEVEGRAEALAPGCRLLSAGEGEGEGSGER
jgi:hypothetical protein